MSNTVVPKPADILLVEDSPTDADLTLRALKRAKIDNGLYHVRDGVEAMAFLRRQLQYELMPTPDLILLDLNMPRKDGREVLREIRADPELKAIPIVVLTTSSGEKDVMTSYGFVPTRTL